MHFTSITPPEPVGPLEHAGPKSFNRYLHDSSARFKPNSVPTKGLAHISKSRQLSKGIPPASEPTVHDAHAPRPPAANNPRIRRFCGAKYKEVPQSSRRDKVVHSIWQSFTIEPPQPQRPPSSFHPLNVDGKLEPPAPISIHREPHPMLNAYPPNAQLPAGCYKSHRVPSTPPKTPPHNLDQLPEPVVQALAMGGHLTTATTAQAALKTATEGIKEYERCRAECQRMLMDCHALMGPQLLKGESSDAIPDPAAITDSTPPTVAPELPAAPAADGRNVQLAIHARDLEPMIQRVWQAMTIATSKRASKPAPSTPSRPGSSPRFWTGSSPRVRSPRARPNTAAGAQCHPSADAGPPGPVYTGTHPLPVSKDRSQKLVLHFEGFQACQTASRFVRVDDACGHPPTKTRTKLREALQKALKRQAQDPKKPDKAEAATQIQTLYRGYRVREHTSPQAVCRKSALKIQTRFRGYRVRAHTGPQAVRKQAASKIQATYRGYRVRAPRKRVREQSATKIQATWRGHRVRRRRPTDCKRSGSQPTPASGVRSLSPGLCPGASCLNGIRGLDLLLRSTREMSTDLQWVQTVLLLAEAPAPGGAGGRVSPATSAKTPNESSGSTGGQEAPRSRTRETSAVVAVGPSAETSDMESLELAAGLLRSTQRVSDEPLLLEMLVHSPEPLCATVDVEVQAPTYGAHSTSGRSIRPPSPDMEGLGILLAITRKVSRDLPWLQEALRPWHRPDSPSSATADEGPPRSARTASTESHDVGGLQILLQCTRKMSGDLSLLPEILTEHGTPTSRKSSAAARVPPRVLTSHLRSGVLTPQPSPPVCPPGRAQISRRTKETVTGRGLLAHRPVTS
mmetsp:Transcript_111092/g.192656  ORF Transcript_111092/g.192656 Transcript_111092/m.192656 type:complete len:852 (-) Transcript_111092:613-3168(-)